MKSALLFNGKNANETHVSMFPFGFLKSDLVLPFQIKLFLISVFLQAILKGWQCVKFLREVVLCLLF